MIHYIVFTFCFAIAAGLRLQDVEEGDCRGTRFQPVPATQEFLTYVQNFKYFPVGSRYDLFLYASGHPRFRQISENELRDNMCLTHNGTDAEGRGAFFGFQNRVLGSYQFIPRGHQAAFDFTFVPSSDGGGVSRTQSIDTITLTDYKTFVFYANCYTINSVQRKGWKVLSLTPNLSASTRRAIENHAVSLGFNRNNFIFPNYDTCRAGVGNNNKVNTGGSPRIWRNNKQFGWSK